MVSGAFHDKNPPPPELGWLFVILGSLAVLAGWTLGILMVIAGRRLKMRKSRTFCIVIAAIEVHAGAVWHGAGHIHDCRAYEGVCDAALFQQQSAPGIRRMI